MYYVLSILRKKFIQFKIKRMVFNWFLHFPQFTGYPVRGIQLYYRRHKQRHHPVVVYILYIGICPFYAVSDEVWIKPVVGVFYNQQCRKHEKHFTHKHYAAQTAYRKIATVVCLQRLHAAKRRHSCSKHPAGCIRRTEHIHADTCHHKACPDHKQDILPFIQFFHYFRKLVFYHRSERKCPRHRLS